MPTPQATAPHEPRDHGAPKADSGASAEPILAMLVKRFPRLSETFILNEVLELRRQGLNVKLFAIMDPHEKRSQPEAQALIDEVVYLRPGSWWAMVPQMLRAARNHPRGTLRALKWARRRSLAAWRHLAEALVLVDELDSGPPAHLHAHFAHSPAVIAYITHLVAGVPYSLTAHAKDLYTTLPVNVAQRCGAANLVVTCTAANRDHLEAVIGVDTGTVMVCRHGIDLARFRTLERTPVPGRILSIGRMVPKKGFDTLVKACALLDSRDVEFECMIVGDGPERAHLDELVRRLDVEHRVRLEPGRSQVALLDLYAEAELFALCPAVMSDGDRDGIPNVILEALAVGIPVVASAISGIPEVIADGRTGALVAPGDAWALADTLERLLGDPAARVDLGAGGRRFAAEHCALDASVAPLTAAFGERLAALGSGGRTRKWGS